MNEEINEPVWIMIAAVFALHKRQLAEHGGQPELRDFGLLESALARPLQLWAYGDPPPDLCALAASYAFGLAKNHPFFDGNKRTAYVVYRLFLRRNGLRLSASREEKYETLYRLASGDLSEEEFAEWIRAHTEEIA